MLILITNPILRTESTTFFQYKYRVQYKQIIYLNIFCPSVIGIWILIDGIDIRGVTSLTLQSDKIKSTLKFYSKFAASFNDNPCILRKKPD